MPAGPYKARVPAAFTDHHLTSSDGLRLHYREFAGGAKGRPALLCLPGLTRNCRDFEGFATRFAPRFRVLTASLRGRGESAYARDPLTYVPINYLQDVGALLDDAGVDRVVLVGTSLGGLISLLLDVTQRGRIAGLVLNDVGPQMEEAGLARVRGQVGRGGNWPSWLIAARDIARRQAAIYPDWGLEQWLVHAKRLCRVSREGRIVWDYDPEIAAPFAAANGQAPLDLWLAFDSFANRPVLSLRGELSDILTADTQAAMAARLPQCRAVTVPRVGHAPTLDEPEAVAALEDWLKPFS
jgi:pimeloyl-ACP methyl ester carboxylesterase